MIQGYIKYEFLLLTCFVQQEEEDYSYSDSWKDDDYFKDFKDSWDRQSKQLPETVADPDMMSSWSEAMEQRVKMVNQEQSQLEIEINFDAQQTNYKLDFGGGKS